MKIRVYWLIRYVFLIVRLSLALCIIFAPVLAILYAMGPFSLALGYTFGFFPAATFLVNHYFHRDEHPIYVNHSILPWQRYGGAIVTDLLMGTIILTVSVPGLRPALQSFFYHAFTSSGRWALQPVVLLTFALSCFVLMALLIIAWVSGLFDTREPLKTDYELLIDSVHHQFGTDKILQGAWLKVKSGQMKAVIGINGCGKSTLFRIAMGQMRADNKMLKVNGIAVQSLYSVPGMIGYLSQKNFLPTNFTVETVALRFVGRAKTEHILQDPRLARLRKQKLGRLSGGERRLLELKLVLALKREFYFLDEPFSELEPMFKAKARDWIATTGKQAAVVLTDHDYRQIKELNPRLLLLQHGRTQEIDDMNALKSHYLPV